jgi:hypothetical protein
MVLTECAWAQACSRSFCPRLRLRLRLSLFLVPDGRDRRDRFVIIIILLWGFFQSAWTAGRIWRVFDASVRALPTSNHPTDLAQRNYECQKIRISSVLDRPEHAREADNVWTKHIARKTFIEVDKNKHGFAWCCARIFNVLPVSKLSKHFFPRPFSCCLCHLSRNPFLSCSQRHRMQLSILFVGVVLCGESVEPFKVHPNSHIKQEIPSEAKSCDACTTFHVCMGNYVLRVFHSAPTA